MKHLIYITVLFLSAFSYAQESSSIHGIVLDFESNNAPLTFAKITIKETGAKVLSNDKGFFKFENLKSGEYTLVISFIGYETKEAKIKVTSSNSNPIELVLQQTTISLEDLVATLANTDDNLSSSTKNN